MFCDQISCIINNTSSKNTHSNYNIAIDKLQKSSDGKEDNRRTKKTTWQRLDEVFNGGKGFSVHYFLPTDVPKALSVESEFE
jgi:hypothetical protein